METIVTFMISIIVFVPVVGYALVFVAAKKWLNNHRKATNIAVNISTLFLLCSVHFLIRGIWGISLLWLLMIMIIVIIFVFSLVHWKVKQEVVIHKILRSSWRMAFLLFLGLYILLLIYGVFSRAIHFHS